LAIKRVLKAIDEIKKGNMVIMLDDEDRENEGDLVYASTFSTPQMVNFMATKARGLICVATSKNIAEQLQLYPMVKNNNSNHETAFTVSVDAKNAKTGISAKERDMAIKILANNLSKSDDLVRPGHIFPLIAKDGGVLERTGHTEGGVDLCKLAGLSPSAVICEVINDDGDMARYDDLIIFAKKYNLHIVYVADLVKYRMQNESLVNIVKNIKNSFLLEHKTTKIEFEDHNKNIHIVYQFGKLSETMAVKFHIIGKDIEFIEDSSRFDSFLKSVDYLSKNSGILLFLDTNNTNNKTVNAQTNIGIGALILNKLGIKEIELLTLSTKRHEFIGIKGFSLKIIKEIQI
jgi:3,4-dihydroxy 2-butanone 4-phosphate synthase/GTP cyclohydrolase II